MSSLYQPLSQEDINIRWDKINDVVESFNTERSTALSKLFDDIGTEFCIAPASGKEFFHNAFPGGLLDHTINVLQFSAKLFKLWNDNIIINTKLEDLLFVALVHDLGKAGYNNVPYYKMITEAWQIKRGELYELNKQMIYMPHIDGSLQLLQEYGVILSQDEYIAIKIHDGAYDKDNEKYLTKWGPHYRLKTSLSYILHQADIMAWQKEYNLFKQWESENR